VNQDEQQLVQQAQAGDTAAFAALVEMHGQFVYNLALRTLNNTQEAEDVAQETFVRAWQGLAHFRAAAQLRTWLYRITTNLCYNRLPRLKADLEALVPANAVLLPERTRPVEVEMITAELREQIYTAVDQLPETYRLLITLRHTDGYSYEEIAEITQMPLGTVKTALFRARQQLREALVQPLATGPAVEGVGF
jgi:RNA polymerase sigma-70 factor (ECF subfamily)